MNLREKQIIFGKCKEFQAYPCENISLHARGRPPTLSETKRDLKAGLGGDCTALCLFQKSIFDQMGVNTKIVYFDNNTHEIDKTIKIQKDIDKKYHSALLIEDIEGIPYLIDSGLQFEEPIPLLDGINLEFSTKSISVIKVKNGAFILHRFDRGSKNIKLKFNPDEQWRDEDHQRAALNNYYRVIPIKYGVLEGLKKKRFRVKNNIGIIQLKDRLSVIEIFKGELHKCAEFLGIESSKLSVAQKNWIDLRKRQGIL